MNKLLIKFLSISTIIAMFLIAWLNVDKFSTNFLAVLVPFFLGVVFLIIFLTNFKNLEYE